MPASAGFYFLPQSADRSASGLLKRFSSVSLPPDKTADAFKA